MLYWGTLISGYASVRYAFIYSLIVKHLLPLWCTLYYLHRVIWRQTNHRCSYSLEETSGPFAVHSLSHNLNHCRRSWAHLHANLRNSLSNLHDLLLWYQEGGQPRCQEYWLSMSTQSSDPLSRFLSTSRFSAAPFRQAQYLIQSYVPSFAYYNNFI